MQASDVTETLDLALAASGLDQVTVVHRPRLLTDNGSSYIAGDLAEWLESRGMAHIRGAPRHPQTQGKIERWHLTLKNRILLEPYYLPGALEEHVSAFVTHYNHVRAHESLVLLCHEVLSRSRVGDSISWRSEGWITGMAQKRGKRALQLMWSTWRACSVTRIERHR